MIKIVMFFITNYPKPTKLDVSSENVWAEDMLARILSKVEGSDKVVKDVNDDF